MVLAAYTPNVTARLRDAFPTGRPEGVLVENHSAPFRTQPFAPRRRKSVTCGRRVVRAGRSRPLRTETSRAAMRRALSLSLDGSQMAYEAIDGGKSCVDAKNPRGHPSRLKEPK